ncbi:hypothetical protein [uncultured Cohaesibacter sp.]|uniref:hypothetical protein n=1 Tax=uncultured Cohaesibacter sp. TaxID=1002546 RepID=UPI00292F2708|nr:hypothetical protein [uncultured Cohaesibacter sp.]
MAGSDNYDSLVGSNPVGVVFSEWALANPAAWDYIRPILLENGGWALFITTPRGRNHAYSTHQMAVHNDDWLAERLAWYDTGLLSAEDIQRERDSGMSENRIDQEYGCSFEADTDEQFISSEAVARARKLEAVSAIDDPMVLGVDVARFGDDKSCIYPRRGRDAQTMPYELYEKLDTMQLSARVAEAINKYKADAVFVDETGLGAGVVDRLRQLGFDAIGINFGAAADHSVDGARKTANKRSQIWENMNQALKTGLAIRDDDRLAFELLAPNYSYDSNNAILLEKKEDMKKRGISSPDIADALALTYSYPVIAHAIQQAEEDRQADEYDPFGFRHN